MDLVGIFGANGFIGRNLTRALVRKGVKTVCFGRQFPLDFQEEFGGSVEMRVIDLHDELATHTKIIGITHVVQLINTSNPAMANKKVVADIESNVIPHVRFINSCLMSGVRSFTFLSSGGAVYGRPQSIPISEEHPTFPLNSYGLTKLFTEHYLRMLSRDSEMEFNILRVANPYGPGQLGVSGQGLIGTLLQRYLSGQPITIIGNGLNERDYLYIDDAIEAIVRAIEHKPFNDVINIGSGRGRSILEVVVAVERALGVPLERQYVEDRTTDAPSNVLDATKAKQLLGWEAKTPFDLGVAQTIRWNLSRRQP